MAQNNYSIQSQRKKNHSDNGVMYIKIIGFIMIFIYLCGCVYKFMSNNDIAIEVVKYGAIELPKVYEGIVIRDEYLFKSDVEGYVTYYFSDGERIKKNSTVCAIKDISTTSLIEKEIEKYNTEILKVQELRSDISASQDDVDIKNENIKKAVLSYVASTEQTRINNLYSFKNKLDNEVALRSQLLLMGGQGSTSSLSESKQVYQQQLDNSISISSTTMSGILSLYTDGYEEIYTIDNMYSLTAEQIIQQVKPNAILNEQVQQGDPIFKIIPNDEWYIASYIPEQVCKGWVTEETKTLTFEDGKETELDMKIKDIISIQNQKLVIFYANRRLLEFLNQRNVSFKVDTKVYNGLKIPNTAIVEKTFVKIPSEYITDSMGQTCIIKNQTAGDILVPVDVLLSNDTEGYVCVLQDFTTVKLNDILIKPNTENAEKYTVSEVITSKGVYVVNNGITELKVIELLGCNDTYSIVNASKKQSIKAYDKIVSDVKNISENQIIY